MIYFKTWLVNVQQFISFKIIQSLLVNWFFFLSRFSFHWRLTGQQGKWGDHLLFHSTTSTRSQTFKHLFATLHVRWLSHIFNRTACIYQIATRWHLPPSRITSWLIGDVIISLVCLLAELILGFCCSNLIRKTDEFKLALTIALVLQANRLTKFASRLKIWFDTPELIFYHLRY